MSNELTKDDLEIILLKEACHMSYSAIAKDLGISKTRVRQKYERAKRRETISQLPDDPSKISFDEYTRLNLESTTYNALRNAKIETYHDFIRLTTLDMIMIKGIGPVKLDELIKFQEKIISYVKKGNRV